MSQRFMPLVGGARAPVGRRRDGWRDRRIVAAMNRQSGFTLLELMTTIAIAALIMGFAVPAMTAYIRNARMTSAANDIVAAIQTARTEAIKRRRAVTLCTASDLDATPACNTAATGMVGWIMFVDNNRNGQWDDNTFDDIDGDGHQDVEEDDGADADLVWTAHQLDEDLDDDGHQDVAEATIPAEQVLAVHAPLRDTISNRSSMNPVRITFLETGFADGGAAGAIVLCDSRGNVASGGDLSSARGISISATGRASVTRDPTEIDALLAEVADKSGDSSAIGGCTP